MSNKRKRNISIIMDRLCNEMTLQEIATKNNLSKERVRQILIREVRVFINFLRLKDQGRIIYKPANMDGFYLRPQPPEEILNLILIDTIELTVRTKNVLSKENIITVRDALKISRTDFLRMPNMGRKSINELEDGLKHLGVALPEQSLERKYKYAIP